jgi:hypothetical protein
MAKVTEKKKQKQKKEPGGGKAQDNEVMKGPSVKSKRRSEKSHWFLRSLHFTMHLQRFIDVGRLR